MENATKALLIAGGVLIAVILITLLVRTYGNISNFQRRQVSVEEAERIEEFNKDYIKYDGQYVYGTEVITVINKADNYNKKKEESKKISVYVDGNKITNIESLGDFTEVKSKPYFCEKITYGEDGIVKEIYFISKNIST